MAAVFAIVVLCLTLLYATFVTCYLLYVSYVALGQSARVAVCGTVIVAVLAGVIALLLATNHSTPPTPAPSPAPAPQPSPGPPVPHSSPHPHASPKPFPPTPPSSSPRPGPHPKPTPKPPVPPPTPGPTPPRPSPPPPAVSPSPRPAPDPKQCNPLGPRISCGEVELSEAECGKSGCCWYASPHNLPACFHENNGNSSYEALNLLKSGRVVTGQLQSTNGTQAQLGDDIKDLKFEIRSVAGRHVHVMITDKHDSRWTVPSSLFKRPYDTHAHGLLLHAKTKTKSLVDVKSHPFSVEVVRQVDKFDSKGRLVDSDLSTLLNSTGYRMIFKDQYIEISSALSDDVSGLFGVAGRGGAATMEIPRDGTPMALWNREGIVGEHVQGSHPFIVALQKDGSAHGLLMLNSNGMEIVCSQDGVSWRLMGGRVDLYVLLGPTPMFVMRQLGNIIGTSFYPPRWSMGLHQSRSGYASVQELEDVVGKYSEAEIGLDAIWSGVDYMKGAQDFTFDDDHYPLDKLKDFVEDLDASFRKWLPVLIPGIAADNQSSVYRSGMKEDVFVKDITGEPYLGQSLPGAVHWPDFQGAATEAWWEDHMGAMWEKVPAGGGWLQHNTPANDCSGDVCSLPDPDPAVSRASFHKHLCELQCLTVDDLTNDTEASSARKLVHPPYPLNLGNHSHPLGWRSVSVTAADGRGDLMYNTHNLYGMLQARATAKALGKVMNAVQRPFIASRSSWLGSAAYAATWTGDSDASWEHMRQSVAQVLTAGLVGLSFTGSNICGTHGTACAELCARWASLGAFYPLARVHAAADSGPKELYHWPEVTEAARNMLGVRYKHSLALSNAFLHAHLHGAPVVAPLWFWYPHDPSTHGCTTQFMYGNKMMVIPVLEEGVRNVTAYFPQGYIWRPLMYGTPLVDARFGGVNYSVPTPLSQIPVYLQGGHVRLVHNVQQLDGHLLSMEHVARNAPLSVMVSLPFQVSHNLTNEALQEDGSRVVTFQDYVYLGDDTGAEVALSPCNFLNLHVTLSLDSNQGHVSARLDTSWGIPLDLAADVKLPSPNAARLAPLDLPPFEGVAVMGWDEGVAIESVDMSVFEGQGPVDNNGGPAVSLTSQRLQSSQVWWRSDTAFLDFSAANMQLHCSRHLSITWSARVLRVTESQ